MLPTEHELECGANHPHPDRVLPFMDTKLLDIKFTCIGARLAERGLPRLTMEQIGMTTRNCR